MAAGSHRGREPAVGQKRRISEPFEGFVVAVVVGGGIDLTLAAGTEKAPDSYCGAVGKRYPCSPAQGRHGCYCIPLTVAAGSIFATRP